MRSLLAAVGLSLAAGCGESSSDSTGSGGAAGNGVQDGSAASGGSIEAGSGGSGGVGGDAGSDAGGAAADATADAACLAPPDTTENASNLAVALCQLSKGCCDAVGFQYPLTQCIVEVEKQLQYLADQALCAGGKWDTQRVADCMTALQSFGCLTSYGTKWDVVHAACDEMMVGPSNPGAPCGSHFDCFPGPGQVASCTNGICLVGNVAAEGQACESSLSAPTGSSVCDEAADIRCVSGVCEKALLAGAACKSFATPCAEGLGCSGGVCAAKGGVGAPCGSALPACEDGLVCLNGICGGQLGASCTGGFGSCAGGLSCVGGKCILPKAQMLSFLTGAVCAP